MLLKPYRVLDLTGPLGFAAGKVFADLGADVVKIEPPGGDAARTEQNLYWVAANAGKRSITLDLQRESGRQTLRALAAKADFLLESFPPGTLESWSVGYEVLRAENPGLIMVSITPFGQDGPYADFEASDLEIMALSGAMSLAGKEGGEPMRVSLPQSPYWVGVESVMGALTALANRASLDGALQREMLGYPVSTVEDIFADRQLEARSFWSEVVDATSGRKMKSPGGFAIINGERLAAGTRAPRIGEHNHEVLQEGK